MKYTDEFFVYKGMAYGPKTVVTFKDSWLKTVQYNNKINSYTKKPIWKEAYFCNRARIINGEVTYMFSYNITNMDKRNYNQHIYEPWFVIPQSELEKAIEFVISRNCVPVKDIEIPKPKSDWEIEGMGALWLIYITILIGSLIFKDFIGIWAIATYVFYKIRKGLKEQ